MRVAHTAIHGNVTFGAFAGPLGLDPGASRASRCSGHLSRLRTLRTLRLFQVGNAAYPPHESARDQVERAGLKQQKYCTCGAVLAPCSLGFWIASHLTYILCSRCAPTHGEVRATHRLVTSSHLVGIKLRRKEE